MHFVHGRELRWKKERFFVRLRRTQNDKEERLERCERWKRRAGERGKRRMGEWAKGEGRNGNMRKVKRSQITFILTSSARAI